MYINTNNTVYTANYQNGNVQIWLEGNTDPTNNITTNSSNPYALFVSEVGDIYLGSGSPHYTVDLWRENATSSYASLSMGDTCYSLFLDGNDSLYCSIQFAHRVVKRSLNSSDNQLTIVAGTGCAGLRTAYAISSARDLCLQQF